MRVLFILQHEQNRCYFSCFFKEFLPPETILGSVLNMYFKLCNFYICLGCRCLPYVDTFSSHSVLTFLWVFYLPLLWTNSTWLGISACVVGRLFIYLFFGCIFVLWPLDGNLKVHVCCSTFAMCCYYARPSLYMRPWFLFFGGCPGCLLRLRLLGGHVFSFVFPVLGFVGRCWRGAVVRCLAGVLDLFMRRLVRWRALMTSLRQASMRHYRI